MKNRDFKYLFVSSLVFLAAGLLERAAAFEAISFSVEEAAGVARKAAPVTGGIPFSKDALNSGQVANLRLFDDENKAVAFVPSVTSRWSWPDGSVQWLLLDFQSDFKPLQKRTFRLSLEGQPAQLGPKVSVRETDDEIAVDTGAIEFVVSKKTFSLLKKVSLGRQTLTGSCGMSIDLSRAVPQSRDEENWLRDAPAGGKELHLTAEAGASKAEVEFKNDLRAVVRLSGTFGGGGNSTRAKFPYSIRISAFAGSSELRIRHALLFDADVDAECIRRIGISIPLQEELSQFSLAGEGNDPLANEPGAPKRKQAGQPGGVKGPLNAGESASLLCIGPPKHYHCQPIYAMARIDYQIDRISGGEVSSAGSGDSCEGWAAAGSKSFCVGAALKDFWKRHPKELTVDSRDKSLNIWLWPDRGSKVLDLRRYDSKKHYGAFKPGEGGRLEAEDQDFGYAYGLAITHEFALSFHAQSPADAPVANLAKALNEPLYAVCFPEQYVKSGVLGPVAAYNPEKFPRIEGAQDVLLEWLMRNRQNFGWYGLLDYGDILLDFFYQNINGWGPNREVWTCRGYFGWMQNDGQYDNMLYTQALRRGDRRLLKFADEMTHQAAEVDTVHLEMPGRANDNAGRPRTGGVHRHNEHHFGDNITSRGTIGNGGYLNYNLTGDLRIKEVLRETAQFLAEETSYHAIDGLTLARLYCLFGDKKMLEDAERIRPRYVKMLAKGERYSFTTFNDAFPCTVHYSMLTGNEDARQALVSFADAVMEGYENKQTGAHEFHQYDGGMAEAIAYQFTHDRKYLAAIPQYFVKCATPKGFGACDLSGEMKCGAAALTWPQLWQKVRGFEPIMPERPYHIMGKFLSKWPFVLAVLQDEKAIFENAATSQPK